MSLPEIRVSEYIDKFGINGLNMVIRRHHLSNQKRSLFTVRYVSDDPVVEREMTREMDKLTREINALDRQIESLGVTKNQRTSIIKDIKKIRPDDWMGGFEL